MEGPGWQFDTIEYIMVENFESYDNEGNDITAVWTDKLILGDMQITLMNDPNLSPINSMYLRYHVPYDPFYTIAARSFSPAQDWTVKGVKILTIHCYGDAANLGLPVFVTIGDDTTDVNVVADVNTLATGWSEINVSLPAIAAAAANWSPSSGSSQRASRHRPEKEPAPREDAGTPRPPRARSDPGAECSR